MTAMSMPAWTDIAINGAGFRLLSPEPRTVRGVVLLLPDVDWPGEADWESLAAAFGPFPIAVAASLERGCWWLVQPAPGEDRSPLDRLRVDVVEELRRRCASSGGVFAAAGAGRGGQGALQLAYRWPRLFPIAAAVSPAVDFHLLQPVDPVLQAVFASQESARQQTATLNLHPLNWPPHQWIACDPRDWRYDGCERLASKLRSIGIPFECDLETTAAGSVDVFHRTQWPRAAAFLAERIEQQAASLL